MKTSLFRNCILAAVATAAFAVVLIVPLSAKNTNKHVNNPTKLLGDFVEGQDEAILNAKAKAFEIALYQDAEFYQFRVLSIRTKGSLRQAEVEIGWK
jgi:hypothetical protein